MFIHDFHSTKITRATKYCLGQSACSLNKCLLLPQLHACETALMLVFSAAPGDCFALCVLGAEMPLLLKPDGLLRD
jgi:hypothetical protein